MYKPLKVFKTANEINAYEQHIIKKSSLKIDTERIKSIIWKVNSNEAEFDSRGNFHSLKYTGSLRHYRYAKICHAGKAASALLLDNILQYFKILQQLCHLNKKG